MDPEVLDLVRSSMGSVRVPGPGDKVYKEECGFSFAGSEAVGGLYINLNTFQAYSEEWVDLDQRRTGQVLYLHELGVKVAREQAEDAQDAPPTQLSIGLAGGFQAGAAPKYDVVKEHALVLLPAGVRVPLPCPDLPELVLQSIAAVQMHEGAQKQEEVAAWAEERAVSRYAEGLEQLAATRTIPMDPSKWRCDETGTTENLWLNLSTGFIGSGRPHWDGTGGTGAALRHYEATGRRYPLAVKLGTITPAGADVYSYAPEEDDMVLDPHLPAHLAHWGINILRMEKTEATMTELQIEKNLSHEFDRITEAGAELEVLTGPGLIGLKNLGNSCYMNSVLQVLWSLPELEARYLAQYRDLFESAPRAVPDDLLTQARSAAPFVKVGHALVHGATPVVPGVGPDAGPPKQLPAVAPAAFKALAGRGHPEFSTNRQQDAEEYWGHLLEILARAERAGGAERLPGKGSAAGPRDLVAFELEDRIQCIVSGKVTYKRSQATSLGLRIPMESASNRAELAADRDQKRQRLDALDEGSAKVQGVDAPPLLPHVPLSACLESFMAEAEVEGVFSAAAAKRTRFATFPEVLLVQLRRYYVAEDWTPRKLEVAVEMPARLSLEAWRSHGVQAGEELQPEAPAAAAPAAQPVDETLIAQLVGMGFSEPGSRRAAVAVAGAGPEAAMEWLLAHMDDAVVNDPLPPAGAGAGPAATAPSPELLSALTSMGFTPAAAGAALVACGGDVDRAADWLFSRMDSLVELEGEAAAGGEAGGPSLTEGAAASPPRADGPGEYELAAFISHMGANTACGHYVCHIKRGGSWVLYNDEKVAASASPPTELGYMYVYRRVADA